MLLLIDNVSKSFGPQVLYTGATLQLNKGDRWALVGPNGAGKTTLLKMILGQEVPDAGNITLSKNTSVGYLEQEVAKPSSLPALEEVLNSVTEIKELEKTIKETQVALADTSSQPKSQTHQLQQVRQIQKNQKTQQELLELLGNAQHRFEELGGYELEAQAKQIMAGLGFKQADFLKPANEFSGGWQMRLALAKLLLKHPDILLLDEPTNHLDLESVRWFESFLASYSGSVLMVSHDRSFMDAVVDHVAALENRTLRAYTGNYSKHLQLRESNLEQLKAKRAAQEKEIAHMQVFVDKFRYKATKAKAAQERMARIEQIKKDLVVLPEKGKHVRFKFPQPPRTQDLVVKLEHVGKTYQGADATDLSTQNTPQDATQNATQNTAQNTMQDTAQDTIPTTAEQMPQNRARNTTVYEDISVKLYRGDRVALVGPNGAGKSTLLKLIAQQIEPSHGQVKLGKGVNVAYYAQHQADALSASRTVLQELGSVATGWTTAEQRRLLGAFLFSGGDVDKKVSMLSGGEKARLALAKMLVKPAPLICLDEPTNHLDIDSVSVLEEALLQYAGTIVLISHDETLVRALANKVVDVRDGSIQVYEGDYDYYLFKHAALEEKRLNEKQRMAASNKGVSSDTFTASTPSATPVASTAPAVSASSASSTSSVASTASVSSTAPASSATSMNQALSTASNDVNISEKPHGTALDGKAATEVPGSEASVKRRGPKTKEQKRKEAEERNRRYQIIAAPKKRMAEIESQLNAKKNRYQELMDLLGDNETYENKELFDAAMTEYPILAKEISTLEDEWLELSLKLEELTKETEHTNDYK